MTEPTRWHIGGPNGPWVIKRFPHVWPDVTVCEVVEAGIWDGAMQAVGVILRVPDKDLQGTMAEVPAWQLGID